MRKPVLFHSPQMADLAKGIISASKNAIVRGSISSEYFADGFPHLKLVSSVRGKDAIYLASFDDTRTIFEQLAVIYAIPRYHARSFTVLLPFFSVGTMDRVDAYGEIVTAMTMARMLSATPACEHGGPARIVIADIHALQEQFYFRDSVVPDLITAMPLLQTVLRKKFGRDVAIAFPDEGAYKRFAHQFRNFPLILCQKRRSGDKREVRIVEGQEYVGRNHVVIVDDLIMTGGTLLECRKVLLVPKPKSISAYATHGVFPNDAWRKFTHDLFANVWITDSCPKTVHAVKKLKPYEIISLAPLLSEMIFKGRR